MKLSLKSRFLLPTVTAFIVGMIITTIVSHVNSKAALNKALKGQISEIVKSTAENLDSWVNRIKQDVGSMSEHKVFKAATEETFMGKAARKSASLQLSKLKSSYKCYKSINLADLKGKVVSSSDLKPADMRNVSETETFQKAKNGEIGVSDVIKNESGMPVFLISSPVRDGNKISGVLFGVVDSSYFSRTYVDTVKIGNTGYAFMFNRKGSVFAHPEKSQILKLNMNKLDFGQEMIKKREGQTEFTQDGSDKIVAYKQSPSTGWTIAVTISTKEIFQPVWKMAYINISVTTIVAIFISIIILLIVRSITNPINHIISGLDESAANVSSSSTQVASASQDLASGSSEQAASVQETSSSLEEMAAMTKQNANNAGQADSLMTEANQVAGQAKASMDNLTMSMEEITKASQETSKIIKTIDEIAFQTNLLALNAAVEAARAGEAGAGFAVVADEVRNLAMRAADAARNTAELIEDTVKKVNEGSEMVTKTGEDFTKVSNRSSKAGELVAEIAAACTEQAQGIEQLNTAVVDMDRMVQQNAASAEESASASEEMTSQAEQMKTFVRELLSVIGNNSTERSGRTFGGDRTFAAGKNMANKFFSKKSQEKITLIPISNSGADSKKDVNPEKVIPLDDEDFEDF